MTATKPVPVGTVLWVELPRRRPRGHEQEGMRPCVVLADPNATQATRYPVLLVAPLTTARSVRPGPLYVPLQAGAGGLPLASTALLDQVAAVDARRVKGYLGQLDETAYAPIRQGLKALLGV